MDRSAFGSIAAPLRASHLPGFLACPLSLVLRRENETMDDNPYTQTGTMIHKGIEAYHKLHSIDSALAVMAHSKQALPLADSAKAQQHFRKYAEKEKCWGEVTATEQHVTITLPAHESDPTKEDIIITGTLDMLRMWGAEWVVDVKTGTELLGADMVNYHAPQLAAYMLGTSATRAAIIRTADFLTGGPVWYPCTWTRQHALTILDPVRLFVAQVRAGKSIVIPGKHCRRCPAGNLGNCLNGKLAVPSTTQAPIRSIAELF